MVSGGSQSTAAPLVTFKMKTDRESLACAINTGATISSYQCAPRDSKLAGTPSCVSSA